jgi:head-tail adaptor
MPQTATAIGTRQYRVVIQGVTDGVDGSGFPIETFVDVATVWAARTPGLAAAGGELLREDQVSARAYHRWAIPYLAAVDPDLVPVAKMRLLHEGRAYDILEAYAVGPHEEIVLTTLVKAA